jgi:hypothetical protein
MEMTWADAWFVCRWINAGFVFVTTLCFFKTTTLCAMFTFDAHSFLSPFDAHLIWGAFCPSREMRCRQERVHENAPRWKDAPVALSLFAG